jgi:hypothetical protein
MTTTENNSTGVADYDIEQWYRQRARWVIDLLRCGMSVAVIGKSGMGKSVIDRQASAIPLPARWFVLERMSWWSSKQSSSAPPIASPDNRYWHGLHTLGGRTGFPATGFPDTRYGGDWTVNFWATDEAKPMQLTRCPPKRGVLSPVFLSCLQAVLGPARALRDGAPHQVRRIWHAPTPVA